MSSYSTAFTVPQSPAQVFAAVRDVVSWWTGEIDGWAAAVGDEFTYRHPPQHYSRQRVVELEPERRVVWRVTDSELAYVAPKADPVPSLAASERAFDARASRYLWRGPTWAVANWSLFHACRQRGFDDIALALGNSLRELVAQSGFREYYNPFTGEWCGAHDFTWSGLILDMV